MNSVIMNRVSIFIVFILTLFFTGCREEDVESVVSEDDIELKVKLFFNSESHVIDGFTRTSGDAVRDIKTFCILVYGEDGSLFRLIPKDELSIVFRLRNEDRPDDIPDELWHQAESKTMMGETSIRLTKGYYRIYALANMGNNLEGYNSDDYSTIDRLRSIVLKWNESEIASNNQMFGYFSTDAGKSDGFEAPLIGSYINNGGYTIYSWLKRTASKVTVAVDGSQLNSGVHVYIKSIQVKDIAGTCLLGENNTDPEVLIEEGEKIIVSDIPGKTSVNSDGVVFKGWNYPNPKSNAHTEMANALYFFENMQGEGQWKGQVWPDQSDKSRPMFPDGNDKDSKGYKDGKPKGTYVEVVAYYVNRDDEGPITYRFMLGSNITTNYDVQRNHHYKLTLKLKNNANDCDWHVVYNPTSKEE